MIAERLRLYEEIRHTEASLNGKKFVPLLSILVIVGLVISSSYVLALVFLFGQNIPASQVGPMMVGCNNPSTTTENLVVDTTRGGTGITFVCPPGNFGPSHYAIQPTGAGTFFYHHAGTGGYPSLWIIPSQTIPIEGCHKVKFPDGSVSTLWSINITASDGGVTFFDGQQAYAYCAEYVTLGSYGPIFVTWSQ